MAGNELNIVTLAQRKWSIGEGGEVLAKNGRRRVTPGNGTWLAKFVSRQAGVCP